MLCFSLLILLNLFLDLAIKHIYNLQSASDNQGNILGFLVFMHSLDNKTSGCHY